LPEAWVELILRLRRAYRMTALAIAERLQLARSTVAAVLKGHRLNRLRLLEPSETASAALQWRP